MTKYLVKVYMKTGESLSFISGDIEPSPFPDLRYGESLNFHWDDHWELLELLRSSGDVHQGWWWAPIRIHQMSNNIQNFRIRTIPIQAPGYVGLTREEGQARALDEGLSFRTVLEDGMQVSVEQGYNDKRVNVYLDQGIVYKAEIF